MSFIRAFKIRYIIVLPEHADFSNVEDVCLLHVQVELDCFDKYEGGYNNDNI